ncbi:MAG TPA: DUF1996 domain-containing protein [Gemmatimonadaceae bacterium]|nr:DUF1996 domain-containing protein [Gemmatimonadaceae bacterium]
MRLSTRQMLSRVVGLALATAGCSAGAAPTSAPTDPSVPTQPATVSSLTVSPVRGQVVVGKTLQLAVAAKDSRGVSVSDAPVTWSVDKPSLATVSQTGMVTGVAQGSVTVRVTSGSVSGTSTVDVTPAGTPAPETFTFCTDAGAPCDFIGLRDVRLVGPSGAYVQQTAYHTIPCAPYGFGGRNPAPNQPLHCEYGPLKTTTLTNPMPGMAGLPAQVIVPLGSPGAAAAQSEPTNETPEFTDGSGSFRTTCSLARFAFDDPVVFPGQPGASHLHAFFGNTAVTASTTAQSILTSGNSTCRGGTLNRTAYWVPAVFDSRTGEVQAPDEGVFYYKTGYNIDPKVVKPFPEGLRMIAGDKSATGVQDFVEWGCRDHYVENTGKIPTTCPVGDAVRLTVLFPQCWDGVHLDSPDHKSHMAFPIYRNPPQVSTCPASHPVTLPQITEHFDYPVSASSAPAFWRLTSDTYSTSIPGGLSAHADWMYGWSNTTFATIVTQCLNKAVDCGVGSIGNGTTLF